MVVGELTPIAGSIINAKAEDIPDNFAKLDTVDWFSVDAFAYPAYDEEEHRGYASDPDGRADLELYFLLASIFNFMC